MADATRTREALLVGLAAGSGATDAFSFVALGHVFTSVITGNLVLVGVSIGALSFPDVLDIAVAVLCYLASAAGAARFLLGRVPAETLWNAALTRMLLAEGGVQAVVLVLWLFAPIRPLLIGLCAVAMGAQSATVRAVPGTGLSTTYLTGTLTALVASFATGRRDAVGRAAGVGVLVALLAGASAEAALLRVLPSIGPVLPLVVSLAVAAGMARLRRA
ncbi:MAG TPA: YoaK family protein [Pseudonocardiaceae bacterium]|nr:YoaK family protein [Pseudonocardiaceae bacterium]